MDDSPGAADRHDDWRPSWQKDGEFCEIFRRYRRESEDNDGRPYPELWDISNGCILWLPVRDKKIEDKIVPGSKLDGQGPGFFDHPILVLRVDIRSVTLATITFAKMTSLGNRSLQEAKPGQPNRWKEYLPIEPAEAHPISGVLLHLEDLSPKRSMTQNSYISLCEGAFSLDWRAFRCYSKQRADGYRQRLNQESFEQVIYAMGLQSSPWIKTGRLWETFYDNYITASAIREATENEKLSHTAAEDT